MSKSTHKNKFKVNDWARGQKGAAVVVRVRGDKVKLFGKEEWFLASELENITVR